MGQVSSKCFGFTLKVETCATSPQLQATKHVKCVVIGETNKSTADENFQNIIDWLKMYFFPFYLI
jgi:S-adenosylmethionine:tRNA-ribosyltransferase-isomerase (queuine synthetase)